MGTDLDGPYFSHLADESTSATALSLGFHASRCSSRHRRLSVARRAARYQRKRLLLQRIGLPDLSRIPAYVCRSLWLFSSRLLPDDEPCSFAAHPTRRDCLRAADEEPQSALRPAHQLPPEA